MVGMSLAPAVALPVALHWSDDWEVVVVFGLDPWKSEGETAKKPDSNCPECDGRRDASVAPKIDAKMVGCPGLAKVVATRPLESWGCTIVPVENDVDFGKQSMLFAFRNSRERIRQEGMPVI